MDNSYSGPLGRSGSLLHDLGGDRREAACAAVAAYRGEELATSLLVKIFRRLPMTFGVRLWSGPTFCVGGGRDAFLEDGSVPAQASASPPRPRFMLCFRHPRAVYGLVLGRDPLGLAEAYFCNDLDIEGDLFAALCLKDHLKAMQLPLRERWSAAIAALQLRALNEREAWRRDARSAHGGRVRAHSRDENREAIEFHYDLSNDFYRLWLDRAMVYSCAYFERADVSLDDAQQAKLEHLCRKLSLRPGERLLDIGCGWGALVIHAAQRYGVYAHGVTLSQRQLSVARQRIAEAGLENRVTVELKDYRDLEGQAVYDKIVSVGMFEHVGLKNLPLYFSTVHRLLKPSGLFLNHGITHVRAGWHKSDPSTLFINRYVFPDGQLDSIANIQRYMEDAEFEIADVEALRPHYALTLRAWVSRLERRHARALEYVSESTYRVWRLYMAASALEFESGQIGVYQVLASKRGPDQPRLPLTRRYLYEERAGSPRAGSP